MLYKHILRNVHWDSTEEWILGKNNALTMRMCGLKTSGVRQAYGTEMRKLSRSVLEKNCRVLFVELTVIYYDE